MDGLKMKIKAEGERLLFKTPKSCIQLTKSECSLIINNTKDILRNLEDAMEDDDIDYQIQLSENTTLSITRRFPKINIRRWDNDKWGKKVAQPQGAVFKLNVFMTVMENIFCFLYGN